MSGSVSQHNLDEISMKVKFNLIFKSLIFKQSENEPKKSHIFSNTISTRSKSKANVASSINTQVNNNISTNLTNNQKETVKVAIKKEIPDNFEVKSEPMVLFIFCKER